MSRAMPFFDIHCHILPAIDDGAFDLHESLDMAAMAAEANTAGIVCTPHVNALSPYPTARISERVGRLSHAAARRGLPIRLFAGQEILVPDDAVNLSRLLGDGHLLTLCGSAYVLLEFLPDADPADVYRSLARLRAAGGRPIVAHPERYDFIARDPALLHRFKQSGFLLQMNKGSVSGRYGQAAARTADYMLSERLADFVASDAHSPYVRTTAMRDVHAYLCEEFSFDYAEQLLSVNPRAVIENRTVHPHNL